MPTARIETIRAAAADGHRVWGLRGWTCSSSVSTTAGGLASALPRRRPEVDATSGSVWLPGCNPAATPLWARTAGLSPALRAVEPCGAWRGGPGGRRPGRNPRLEVEALAAATAKPPSRHGGAVAGATARITVTVALPGCVRCRLDAVDVASAPGARLQPRDDRPSRPLYVPVPERGRLRVRPPSCRPQVREAARTGVRTGSRHAGCCKDTL